MIPNLNSETDNCKLTKFLVLPVAALENPVYLVSATEY